MNGPSENRFRETGWRRPLTNAEQAELRAWLAAHPEVQADWQAEATLNTALRKLSDAPLPTNFTARVLQEIERDAAAARQRAGFWRSVDWRRWLPRTALAGLAVVAVILSLRFQQAAAHARMGRSVAAMAMAPSPDLLKDFESIKRLQAAPVADKELLKLLR
jgi:anti-sigma factor RsiW